MQLHEVQVQIKRILAFLLFLPLLYSCNRLDSIPYSPKISPEAFLSEQPHTNIRIAGSDYILIQPTSTIFVYSLGLITLFIGLYFLKKNRKQKSKIWWGIALLFWGLGALLAGTSYQAFGFEIKCAGREFCIWTSWWEVFYMIFTAASIDAMLMAQTYSSVHGKWKKPLRVFAVAKFVTCTGLILSGALIPTKFLVSFELLILVSLPVMFVFIILNAYRYKKEKDPLDLLLLLAWIFLGLIIAVYFLYLISGFGEQLYKRGIWFTSNDVLHLGLILWMLYILLAISVKMKDIPHPNCK